MSRVCRCKRGPLYPYLRDNDGELGRVSPVGEERVQRLGHRHPVAGEHQHGDHHAVLEGNIRVVSGIYRLTTRLFVFFC